MNDAVEVGLRISPLIHGAEMKPSENLLAEKALFISSGPCVKETMERGHGVVFDK